MKYKLLRFSLTCILAMLWGVLSPIWADTGTITFGNNGVKINAASVTGNDDLGNSWTVTTEGTTSFTANSAYYQVGSGNKPATSITFTTTLPKSVTITSCSAKFGGFNGTAGDVSLKVGNTEVGSGSLNGTSDVTVSSLSTTSLEGTVLTVSVTNIAKGVKCYNIIYTYADASDTRVETTLTLGDYETSGYVGSTMSVPEITVATETTELENPAISWESSNAEVATIEEGVIYLKAVGSATITATYAGDETNYKGSSADFTLTVSKAPYTSIADMVGDVTSTKTRVTYQFENLLVTYFNGKYTYVSDDQNGFLFFGNNLGLNLGEMISGSAIGDLYTYNGLPEMSFEANGTTIDAEVISSNNKVVWETITPADLADNVNKPVVIKNAVYVSASGQNLTFKVGDDEFIVRNTWNVSTTDLVADKAYTLVGMGSVYVKSGTTTYQLYLVSFQEEVEEPAGFRDIKLNLMEHSELTTGSPVYITVSEDGSIGTTDDANKAAATITASAHGSYGSSNFTASVPVEGCVKITYATHDYGNDITVTSDNNEEVAKFNTNGEKWMVNHDNVVVAYYRVNQPTTLHFSKANYNPYFAVEAIDEADLPAEVTKYTITFDKGKGDGVAPAAIEVEKGQSFTAPKNYTIFAENKTLTGWTPNETDVYEIGQEITPEGDMTLTAVLTDNDVELADRTEAVTVTFALDGTQGKYNINNSGFIVTQATVEGNTIDVKADISAGSLVTNNDWHQVKNGFKATIPSAKGATVVINTYDDPTNLLTFGESSSFEVSGANHNWTATYTATDDASTLNIAQSGSTYWKSLVITLPVVQSEEPGDDNVLYSWDAGTEKGGTAVPSDNQSVGYANADYTTIRLNGANDFSSATVTITLEKALKAGDEIAITGYRNKDAAGKKSGALLKFEKGSTNVSTATNGGLEFVNINSAVSGTDEYGIEPNTVTLTVPEDAAGSKTITLTRSLTGTNLFITKLVITGERSGDEPGDETYALTCEVNPENSGTVAVSLDEAGESVVEDLTAIASGTELYVTATPEEGYKFLNFYVGNSNEAILDNPYKFTLTEETSVVANFTEDNGEEPVIEYPILYTWDFTDANSDATKVGGGQGATYSYPSDKDADVTLEVDATNGKFNPRGNDVQVNATTTINVPVKAAGDVITIYNYRNGANGVTYTIGTEEKTASDVTYEYTVSKMEAKTGFVTITVTGNGYMDKFTVLQNEPQGEGVAVDATGSVSWTLGNEANGTVADDIKAYVSSATASIGSGLATSTKTVFDQQMLALKPATSNPGNEPEAMVEYRIKVAAGLTFTPTSVSYDAVKNGTDNASYSWSYVVDGIESTVVTVSKDDIIRNNNTTGTPPMRHTENFSDVSGSEFAFRIYVSGFGNTKDLDIANIVINGTVSGTMIEVAKYKLTAVVSNDEAGSVNLYPAADEYEEGTEVTLTATENFGYDFVNWTNAGGEEVSAEAKFKYTVNSDETLTANFKAVETYELALTVDGTNDYMVAVSPAPTEVDGKMMYEAGTAVELTANSYEGLVTFNNWSDGETNSSKLISMTEDITLTAVYEQAEILAGWDFYETGNSGRVADFASTDNETAALSLVLTSDGTTTSSWLDKSTASGGYESFKGAAVNWKTGSSNGDVGNWHWQTKVDASQFTDINVQFQMLYNYNAYQTYNAEYSLDGENWTKFGSVTMTGTKSPASFSEQLPEAANNQKNLFIRMLADKTSKVDGASSANDGNTLAMFFITGTEKLVDDETAPKLVSTVPADGATGASASGKVVLTFDEKVKVAEGTTATLGSLTLTPVVSGKSISFEYKGLEYSSEYNFSLPAGSVSDLTDNTLTEAISLTFTTMTRPTVMKGLYDEVVGNVDELVAAINNANKRSDTNTRYRIFLKNGTYALPLSTTETINSDDGNTYPAPFTKISASNISFIGESRDGVIVTNSIDNSKEFAGTYGTTNVYDGIGKSDVLQLQSSVRGTYFQDLTVQSSMNDARGRNIAVQDKGSQTIYKNTVLWGYQDTWTSNNDNGYYYFEGGKVRGRTDFLCGKGDAFFNAVDIQVCMNTGGYIAVPSKSIQYGYVFKDCTIKGESSELNGKYTLGRPWGQGTPIALWIDTKMEIVPSAIGWSEMSNGWPMRFAEWNSTNSGGSTVNLSDRKKTFGDGHENNPVLTAEEALEAGDLHNMFGDWNPTIATEQAPVPQNVKQEGNSLVWDNSNYALLWAIVKDGAVVDFTTEPTYELTESGTYAVRAANEMGGLSEASESVEATVAEMVKVTLNKGYSTLASDKALDFSKVEGLTAYIVTSAKDSKATLTSVDAAPAETGLVLKTDESGDYEIPVVASATAVEVNLLVAAVNGATVDALSVYVLDDGKFKVFAGTEIPAGKAYLPKSKIGAARLLELVFDDATGIATVDVDVPVNVYDLQGRRVKTAKKGIYVIDGKKVIIK